MSNHPDPVPTGTSEPLTIADLARQQHAREVGDVAEFAADVWESDEELGAFLADLRASRNASMA